MEPMFAVLKTGGKQYRVATGDVLKIERLAAEAGETVQFNEVLVLGGDAPVVGTPRVVGAAVQAQVVDQIRGEKTIHFVKRRRKHGSQRTKGHRQYLTVVRITDILAAGADATGVKAAIGSGSPVPAAAPVAEAPAKPKRAAKKPAAEAQE
jgi:large subunit ribosomal protein L21